MITINIIKHGRYGPEKVCNTRSITYHSFKSNRNIAKVENQVFMILRAVLLERLANQCLKILS